MTILYEKFWVVIIVSLIYIILSITLHAWTLIIRWNNAFIHNWPLGFYCCFTSHRISKSAFYRESPSNTTLYSVSNKKCKTSVWVFCKNSPTYRCSAYHVSTCATCWNSLWGCSREQQRAFSVYSFAISDRIMCAKAWIIFPRIIILFQHM